MGAQIMRPMDATWRILHGSTLTSKDLLRVRLSDPLLPTGRALVIAIHSKLQGRTSYLEEIVHSILSATLEDALIITVTEGLQENLATVQKTVILEWPV